MVEAQRVEQVGAIGLIAWHELVAQGLMAKVQDAVQFDVSANLAFQDLMCHRLAFGRAAQTETSKDFETSKIRDAKRKHDT
jgi:hypothetical protein